jgi:thioredoxin-like negative regulator of GroEL
MSLGGRKTKIALLAAVLVAGCVAAMFGQQAWGRHHYDAAQEALAQRDFQQAGAHLRSCLWVWPYDVSLRLLAAQTLRRGGNLDEAYAELRVYGQLHGSESKRALEQRLLVLQHGDQREADQLLRNCIADPESADAYLTLEAVILATVDRLEELQQKGVNILDGKPAEFRLRTERALTHWLARHQDRTDQVQGLIWRGRLQLLTMNQEEAIADFDKALKLDPECREARLNLATTLYERDPKGALEHLEILWQRDRGNEKISYLLANCRRTLGQIKEAEQLLDEFLSDNPRHAGALLERGKTALDGGWPEEAEQFLRRAVAEAPDDPAVQLTLSRCLHLTGKESEAQRHQRRYREIAAEGIRRREMMLTEMRAKGKQPTEKK